MAIWLSATIKSIMDSRSIRSSHEIVVTADYSYDWAVQNSFLSQHITVSEFAFFLPLANDRSVGMATGLEQILCMPALQCWHGTASSFSIRTTFFAFVLLTIAEMRYGIGAPSQTMGRLSVVPT